MKRQRVNEPVSISTKKKKIKDEIFELQDKCETFLKSIYKPPLLVQEVLRLYFPSDLAKLIFYYCRKPKLYVLQKGSKYVRYLKTMELGSLRLIEEAGWDYYPVNRYNSFIEEHIYVKCPYCVFGLRWNKYYLHETDVAFQWDDFLYQFLPVFLNIDDHHMHVEIPASHLSILCDVDFHPEDHISPPLFKEL